MILNDEGEIVPVVEAEANLSTFGPTKYPEAKLLKTVRGDTSSRGTCTLYTTVYKGSYDSSTKKYNFSTHSKVAWSEPVWMGGADYHGSGWDYLLQSLPNTFTINSDTLDCAWWKTAGVADSWWYSSSYDDGKVWTSRGNGKSNYVQWNIKDEAQWDPLGYCIALADANLTVTSRGPASSSDRVIRSYYVHTWDSATLNVGVSASTTKECLLTLSPSTESKSWKLYSYVTFNDSSLK